MFRRHPKNDCFVACCAGNDSSAGQAEDGGTEKSSGWMLRPSFWLKFRPDDGDNAPNSDQPHSSGSGNGDSGSVSYAAAARDATGGKKVWLQVIKVFGRSERAQVNRQSTALNIQPGDDIVPVQPTLSPKDVEFDVCEVVKSKTLPQVYNEEDRPRYTLSLIHI